MRNGKLKETGLARMIRKNKKFTKIDLDIASSSLIEATATPRKLDDEIAFTQLVCCILATKNKKIIRCISAI
jgi:hypothetical protein